MANNRKDNKGRVLKAGEGQRKDDMYYYRFTDPAGKRKTIYATTLKELRSKEEDINKSILNGSYLESCNMTVGQVVKWYLERAKHFKPQTLDVYTYAAQKIQTANFSNINITNVNVGMAKECIFDIINEWGVSNSRVKGYYALLKGAFQMAYENDMIVKNPFQFKLSAILPPETTPETINERRALTDFEVQRLLDFTKTSNKYKKYYDELVVLLGTGLRVGECAGLTIHDIDFNNNTIYVKRQLCIKSGGKMYITPPKSKAGIRKIPMTQNVAATIKKLWNAQDKKVNYIVDGQSGFIFVKEDGTPYNRRCFADHLRQIIRVYNRRSSEKLPEITPHSLRHTYCTRLIASGVPLKTVQVVMGHESFNTTMDIYTHAFESNVLSDVLENISDIG